MQKKRVKTLLSDLEHNYSVVHVAGREYRVRYSLNALLCLEMTCKPIYDILEIDYREWDIETVLQLLRAAMCDLPENREAVCRRDWDMIVPDIATLGAELRAQDLTHIRAEIMDAILASLPAQADEEQQSSGAGEADEGHLYALAVRVVGMSEDEFWDSSYRELYTGIDKYMEVKGLKEMPSPVRMFDKAD